MKFGTVHNIPPEPHKPEHTRFIEAGALRFGVELRHVDVESMRASYAADPVALARFNERGDRDLNDGGVSIHVFGADDGHEYLRFDCFDEEPHNHYNRRVAPGEDVFNHRVSFDPIAGGEMLPWVLAMLQTRLPQMLTQARGSALAASIDAVALRRALDEIARLARAAA